jgi:minor extracellular serine protease Vpr
MTKPNTESRRTMKKAHVALFSLLAAACAPAGTNDDGAPDSLAPEGSDAPTSDTVAVTAKDPLPFTGEADVTKYEEIDTWFIELEADPLVLGGESDALDQDLEAFRSSAFAAGLVFEERRHFRGIINGVSVRMLSDQLPKLKSVGRVRSVHPVGVTSIPELQHVSEPQLGTALGMTGADYVQNELGYDGTGIKVGVIDTGIDLQHPDLKDRIIGGFDFVGDAYDGANPAAVPVPEPGTGSRPGGDDCAGHGTHVAGIVGASGNPATGGARGVAPGVGLAAYRVFGCSGSTNDDVIVQAIERAYEDGMDIINLSLGSNNGWPDDFMSLALSRVLELGMIPVASAGNNGASGTFTAGSPAAGRDVITVASFDNLFTRSKKGVLSDGTEFPFGVLAGTPQPPTSGETPAIVYVGQGCNADAQLANPSGKVALITRGTCAFGEKYAKALAAGAVGVIVENNVAGPGNFGGTIGGTSTAGFGITISQGFGAELKAKLATSTITLRWTAEVMLEQNPRGDLLSAFSSYGLTPDLLLKPDIGAPGGQIRSTWPLERTEVEQAGYNTIGGTSMSSPYVAGSVALLLQARPDLPADQVRTVLQNNAEPKPWFGDRASGKLDSAHHQGAGMVRIDRAIQAKTLVTPSKLSLGESQAGPFSTTLYLENQSDTETTYTLGKLTRVLATSGSPNVPTFFEAESNVTFTRVFVGESEDAVTSVTVPAHGTRHVNVTIEAPKDLADGSVYGGYLTFTPSAGGATAVSVPFAGYKGDFQELNVVSADPRIVVRAGTTWAPVAAGQVFTMKGIDRPAFSLGLLYGVQRMTVQLQGLDGNAWLGPIDAASFVRMRRSNPGTTFTITPADFDSTFLPDGRYRVRVDLLKALGDASNPRHHQVVDSPWFVIKRGTAAPL